MDTMTTALSYAQMGWKLIELAGVVEPEVCTCWKGRDCGTPGKHPISPAWQETATDQEEIIASWFERNPLANIGLLLGPKSGVIDVELDSKEAKAAWNELNLGEVYTPTYTSGRGPHRLFKWTDDLPRVSIKKPLGIEVRLGGDGGVQSVLPPSRHHTGEYYQWVDGLSPDDVPLAELPDKLKALLASEEGGTSITRIPARTLLHRSVEEGSRNMELHKFAVREGFRATLIDDPQEQQDLLVKIRMVNQTNIKPPLSENECTAIFRSVVAYVRKNKSAGVDANDAIERYEGSGIARTTEQSQPPLRSWQRVFTETGLTFVPQQEGWDAEWMPGEWRITVVHSDPLEYRLHVPSWCRYTANGTGSISLTVDQYRSAARVATAVLAATGVVMLDDEPGKWKKIWDGGESIAEGRDQDGKAIRTHKSRGLRAKLLDNVAHEYPGSSSQRYVALASWLYDRLSQASQPNDEDIPDSTGRASWRQDGTLWFSWSRVWEDIERQHRVNEGERLSTKRRILARLGDDEKDFKHSEYRHVGGSRRSYVVWTKREFAALEELATEDGENAPL